MPQEIYDLILKLRNGFYGEKGKFVVSNPYLDFESLADYLAEKGRRIRTIRAYMLYVHKFMADVNPTTLQDFNRHIIRMEKNDPEAIRRQNYLVYVTLIKYLHAIGKVEWISYLPKTEEIEKPKSGSRDKSITDEEFKRLISLIDDDTYGTLVKVLHSSGLRITEGLSLQLGWIDFSKVPVEIRIPISISKSREEGVAYLPNKVAGELEDYIRSRLDVDNVEELITDKDSKKIYVFELTSREPGEKSLKTLFDEINLVRIRLRKYAGNDQKLRRLNLISPHFFRYSFAHNLSKQGFMPEEIRTLMRHSNINTTQIYLKTRDEEIRRRFNEAFNR